MTRRTALWSLGIAATVLGLVLLGIDQRLLQGLGHSPQVEAPGRTAGLILAFAAG